MECIRFNLIDLPAIHPFWVPRFLIAVKKNKAIPIVDLLCQTEWPNQFSGQPTCSKQISQSP